MGLVRNFGSRTNYRTDGTTTPKWDESDDDASTEPGAEASVAARKSKSSPSSSPGSVRTMRTMRTGFFARKIFAEDDEVLQARELRDKKPKSGFFSPSAGRRSVAFAPKTTSGPPGAWSPLRSSGANFGSGFFSKKKKSADLEAKAQDAVLPPPRPRATGFAPREKKASGAPGGGAAKKLPSFLVPVARPGTPEFEEFVRPPGSTPFQGHTLQRHLGGIKPAPRARERERERARARERIFLWEISGETRRPREGRGSRDLAELSTP